MESETKGRTKQWTHFSCQLGATTFSRFVTTWTTIVINDTLQSSTSVIMLSFEAPSIIPTVFNAVKQISVSLCYLITTTSLKKIFNKFSPMCLLLSIAANFKVSMFETYICAESCKICHKCKSWLRVGGSTVIKTFWRNLHFQVQVCFLLTWHFHPSLKFAIHCWAGLSNKTCIFKRDQIHLYQCYKFGYPILDIEARHRQQNKEQLNCSINSYDFGHTVVFTYGSFTLAQVVSELSATAKCDSYSCTCLGHLR